MSNHPPLPVLLTIGLGGVVAMYGLAFEQLTVTVVAVVAALAVCYFLLRKPSEQGQEAVRVAFTAAASTSVDQGSGLSARAMKRQEKFAKKADREAKVAARQSRKLDRRKSRSKDDGPGDDFDSFNEEPQLGATTASVFGGAVVNVDLVPDAPIVEDNRA